MRGDKRWVYFLKLLNEIDLSKCESVCLFVDKVFLPSPQSQNLPHERQNEVRKHVKDLLVERKDYKDLLRTLDDRGRLRASTKMLKSFTCEDASSEGLRRVMLSLSRELKRIHPESLENELKQTTLKLLAWFLTEGHEPSIKTCLDLAIEPQELLAGLDREKAINLPVRCTTPESVQLCCDRLVLVPSNLLSVECGRL
ncbi:unnamed protein product [Symbiodinium sp. CCMP2592]|nr:unnamed protein product [Symbiodinium sp. CCMP2592]